MRVKASSLKNDFKNSFLSCERDQELIWRKLFVENRQYGDKIKRLLILNTPDCLDETKVQYRSIIDKTSIADLRKKGYLKVVPKINLEEHEDMKSYILLGFEGFAPTENPRYKNCIIHFFVISNLDAWELDDYKLRPYQIAGYIDGVFDGARLTGIGELEFIGGTEVTLNENWGGLILRYAATHAKAEDSNPDIEV